MKQKCPWKEFARWKSELGLPGANRCSLCSLVYHSSTLPTKYFICSASPACGMQQWGQLWACLSVPMKHHCFGCQFTSGWDSLPGKAPTWHRAHWLSGWLPQHTLGSFDYSLSFQLHHILHQNPSRAPSLQQPLHSGTRFPHPQDPDGHLPAVIYKCQQDRALPHGFGKEEWHPLLHCPCRFLPVVLQFIVVNCLESLRNELGGPIHFLK